MSTGLPTTVSSILKENEISFEDHKKYDFESFSTTTKRNDLTNILVFSIDPEGCKDIDDALSCEIYDNTTRVGVHITDITSMIPKDSEIDLTAKERAFSVYLPTKTIPMIPEEISNNLGSLIKNKKRETLSIFYEFNEDGKLKTKAHFNRSIIQNSHNFSYNEAQNLIDSPKEEIEENMIQYQNPLQKLVELSKLLKQQREIKGVVFDKEDVDFEYDDGKLVKITKKQKFDVHEMVEEFMVLTNKSVAKYLIKNSSENIILRAQLAPNQKKLEKFQKTCKKLSNLNVNIDSKKDFFECANDIKNYKGKHTYDGLLRLYYKEIPSAYYVTSSAENLQVQNHFSLIEKYYCNITSPLRRYSDLVTMRQLFEIKDNGNHSYSNSEIVDIVEQCNMKSKSISRSHGKIKIVYLRKYLKENPLPGIKSSILSIDNNNLTVWIPSLGLEQKVRITSDQFKKLRPKLLNKLIVTVKPHNEEKTCLFLRALR